MLRLSKEQQGYQARLQLASLKPNLSLTSNLPGYTRSINSITQPDGSLKFQTQSQAYSTLGITASQAIPLSGGRLSLVSGLNRIDLFDPARTTNWSSNLFILSYSQPLLQYNELKNLRPNVLPTQILNTAQNRKRQQQLKQQITALILDYVLTSTQIENARNQITEQPKTNSRAKNIMQAGKLLQEDIDLLQLELKRAKNSVQNMGQSLETLAAQLVYHLGADVNLAEIKGLDIAKWSRPSIDRDSLLALAQSDPTGLQNTQAILLAQQDVDRQRQNSGLSASFDVSFGYNQRADDLGSIYQNPLDRQMGTISVSVPILDGGRAKYNQLLAQNSFETAKLQKQIAEQTINQQVENILRQYAQIENNIILAKGSLTIAKQRANRYKNLFEAGKITIDQYLQAVNYYQGIEFDLQSAYVNFWKLKYSYQF